MTQTCFQGRFGDEVGSDQFGAQILSHQNEPDSFKSHLRLEQFEMTYVGQAFRLGRYAIHFHLNGDQTGSYVKVRSRGRDSNLLILEKSYELVVPAHTSSTLHPPYPPTVL